MNRDELIFWLTLGGVACWAICFVWMHRISATQNRLLSELKEQAKRIESLSKEEHALIKEVHPKVNDIKDSIEKVVEDIQSRN